MLNFQAVSSKNVNSISPLYEIKRKKNRKQNEKQHNGILINCDSKNEKQNILVLSPVGEILAKGFF